jgi:hypothetical protein
MTVGQIRKLSQIDCLSHQERDEIIGYLIDCVSSGNDGDFFSMAIISFPDEEVSEPEATFPDGDLE